jgi:hypothetical protein
MKKSKIIGLLIIFFLGCTIWQYCSSRVYVDTRLGDDSVVDITHLITSKEFVLLNKSTLRRTVPLVLHVDSAQKILDSFKVFLQQSKDTILWSRFKKIEYPVLQYEYEYSYTFSYRPNIVDVFSIRLPIQLPMELKYPSAKETCGTFYFEFWNGKFTNEFAECGWVIPNPNRVKKN